MIVHVPAKFRHLAPPDYADGGASARPVGFVDFAPTVLALAGLTPPSHMQGRAFMGAAASPSPRYLFAARGRMDERYDLMRSVRDERYVYVRNYMPHRPAGQYLWYGALMPSWRAWRDRFLAGGTMSAAQASYWRTKPTEELYDLRRDPDQLRNLADAPALGKVRARLRAALTAHAREIRDVGFLPEYLLHRGRVPRELGLDRDAYDLDRVREAASDASDPRVPLAKMRQRLVSEDSAVRYWAAVGYVVRGAAAVGADEAALVSLLDDQEPGPRCAAGEALARWGSAPIRSPCRRRAVVVVGRDHASRVRRGPRAQRPGPGSRPVR